MHAELLRMAITIMLSLLISGGLVRSQECVQNLPLFANQGGGGDVPRFVPSTQVIIPDYSFNCYGNVTLWGAWVQRPGGNEEYTLDFEVWRRSGGGQGTTGCYDLVGNNLFQMVNPDDGEIVVPVAVEDQIQVRPGDVVGFSVVSSNRAGNGVELQDTGGRVDVTAWYGPLPMSGIVADSCRIQVGDNIDYQLHSSTTAAPIITVSVVAIPPTSAVDISSSSTTPLVHSGVFIPLTLTSAILVLSSSPTQPRNELTSHGLPPGGVQPATVTRQTREPTPPSLTATQHTQLSSTGTPPGTPSTTSPGSPLSTAAVTGIVLGSILVILIAVVSSVAVVVKHSHSKQTAEQLYETPDANGMEMNQAYETNPQIQHIATAANEAYGCAGGIPVVQNVAYIPAAVNIPTVQNEAYGMESRDNTGDGEYAYVATNDL